MVSGFDDLTKPIGDLPLLWDSTEWIAGFQNIVGRVHEIRISNQWSLDVDTFASPDNADVIAWVGPESACCFRSG